MELFFTRILFSVQALLSICGTFHLRLSVLVIVSRFRSQLGVFDKKAFWRGVVIFSMHRSIVSKSRICITGDMERLRLWVVGLRGEGSRST